MQCSIDGCGAKVLARGWCTKHYTRWQRHGDPLSITRTEPMKAGAVEKFCPKCKATKPLVEFRVRTRGAPSGYCRDCMDAYHSEYIQTATGRKRRAAAAYGWTTRNKEYFLMRNYGITLADYVARLEAQGNCCAICRTTKPGGQSEYFHVDHCHATGRVRGLLCATCNLALGMFKDDPARIRAAASYLEIV